MWFALHSLCTVWYVIRIAFIHFAFSHAHTLTRSTLIQQTHVLNLNCIRVVCCVFHLIQVCELQCFLFHENRTCNLPSHTFHMKTQVFSASFNLTQVCSSHKCGVCFFPLQCARLTVVWVPFVYPFSQHSTPTHAFHACQFVLFLSLRFFLGEFFE